MRRVGRGRLAVAAAAVVVGGLAVSPAEAHVTSSFTHPWKKHIGPKLATVGTVNSPADPVHWTKLKGVPPALANGDDAVGGADGAPGAAGPAGPQGEMVSPGPGGSVRCAGRDGGAGEQPVDGLHGASARTSPAGHAHDQGAVRQQERYDRQAERLGSLGLRGAGGRRRHPRDHGLRRPSCRGPYRPFRPARPHTPTGGGGSSRSGGRVSARVSRPTARLHRNGARFAIAPPEPEASCTRPPPCATKWPGCVPWCGPSSSFPRRSRPTGERYEACTGRAGLPSS
jgi:hypothetical protein